jgi:hypothetical protein
MSQYVLSKGKEAHVRPVLGSSSGLCRNQKQFLLPPTHAALDFLFTSRLIAELLILQLCWSVRNSGSMHRGEWLNFTIMMLVEVTQAE